MLSRASKLVDEACTQGVFPGASLTVSENGKVLHQTYHGLTSKTPPGVAVTKQTLFDLASMTKVLATSTLALLAVRDAKLDLHAPVEEYLPDLHRSQLGKLTATELLEHSSGLAAWVPFYQEVEHMLGRENLCTMEAKNAIFGMLAKQPLLAPPGQKAVYSDLGFILLGQVLEHVLEGPLDEIFSSMVTGPVGIEDLFYVDLKNPAKANAVRQGRVFAATEKCPWRSKLMVGEVHDQNTWAGGGVGAQAGLFGTGESVIALCHQWLSGYKGKSDFLERKLVKRFWTRSKVAGSTRTLGFDTMSPSGSQAGTLMGKATVGHLGYTGTSLWIDPEQETIVVLLTNRIHPSVDNESIKQFRPKVHDAIIEELRGEKS